MVFRPPVLVRTMMSMLFALPSVSAGSGPSRNSRSMTKNSPAIPVACPDLRSAICFLTWSPNLGMFVLLVLRVKSSPEKVLLTSPVAHAEYRSHTGSIQARPCLSPRRVLCARRVGERPVGRGTEGTASVCEAACAPGCLLFGDFFLDKQEKGTCR